jgi:hypothetical protein
MKEVRMSRESWTLSNTSRISGMMKRQEIQDWQSQWYRLRKKARVSLKRRRERAIRGRLILIQKY